MKRSAGQKDKSKKSDPVEVRFVTLVSSRIVY